MAVGGRVKKTAKQQKKRGQYISKIHSKNREVLLDCRLQLGKKSVITNEQIESMQIKAGGKVSSEQNTSGRDRGQRQETAAEQRWKACVLRTQTPCGVYLISKSNSVILQTRWTCFLKGRNDSLIGLLCVRHQKHPELTDVFS